MENVYIENSVKLGKNVVIEPFCFLSGNTEIGDNTKIYAFTKIVDSKIGDDCIIISSHIENSEIGANNQIGPMSKIKANTIIKDNCVIGNFVEIKNSIIESNTKIKHLSYIGDADLGNGVNVGCGVVFANYDGKQKHRINVSSNVFIGCNSVLVAPISIDKNCFIGAGSVITKDLNEFDFAISRAELKIKSERAKLYLKSISE